MINEILNWLGFIWLWSGWLVFGLMWIVSSRGGENVAED
jgi:hypothetical protein